jgi:hypothetical protein
METLNVIQFAKLSDNEKWDRWEELEGVGWFCPYCSERDEREPHRSDPFHGAWVGCEDCDMTLTERTNGGQNDPFNWIPYHVPSA